MEYFINFGLMREPLNWVTVFLMLAFGALLLGMVTQSSRAAEAIFAA